MEEEVIQSIAEGCCKAINDTPPGIDASITLVMPGTMTASGKKPIVPGSSCVGSTVQEHQNNRVMVIFDALDLLAWCIANGALVDIRRRRDLEDDHGHP